VSTHSRLAKQTIYEEAAERDQGACQDCNGKAAGEIHHIVRRGYWGKNAKHRGEVVENLICLCWHAKHRGEVVENLICLCWHHHQGSHTKEAQRRHLALLREKHGYPYDEQPWLGLLGEA